MSKRVFLNLDWSLIVPAAVLVTLSLTTLLSINFTLFKNQSFFLIFAVFAFLFFSQANYKIIRQYSVPIYIASTILLILVLAIGIESRGAVRWFEIFGFRIQFSELIKPFLAISLSSYLAKNENYSFNHFALAIFLMLPVAYLINLQPDLGNALVYTIVTVLTLIVFGFPMRFIFLSAALLTVALPIAWRFLRAYQRQRILSFFHPTDPLGFSYNAIQSGIAIGSGIWVGRGFGQGTQSGLKFLPERHTDFIFATLAEELGFIGTIVVLLCFTFLLYRIFLIFVNSQDKFCKLFSAIAFFFILSQFFINIAMNVGFLPIVGISLPFVSYGGSSLLSNFILLGLVSSIGKDANTKRVLEIK